MKKVKSAREVQEAEEKAKADRRAERKAQKERKLLELEQSTLVENASAPTSWNCPTCTFENGLSVRKCGVCGTYRPTGLCRR